MKPILASHIKVPLLDLLLFKRGHRFGVEIKRMDAVAHRLDALALANLQLEHPTVVSVIFMSWRRR